MRSEGADDIFILMSSGKHNNEMHEPTDRRFREGDVIIGEISPGCEGQFMQLCRTVYLGKPSPVLHEKYDILLRALDVSLAAMRTGASASLITSTMNQVIGEAGYGKYCGPPYVRSRGHGFGVGSIAPGAELTDKMQTCLEETPGRGRPSQSDIFPRQGTWPAGNRCWSRTRGLNDCPKPRQNFM